MYIQDIPWGSFTPLIRSVYSTASVGLGSKLWLKICFCLWIYPTSIQVIFDARSFNRGRRGLKLIRGRHKKCFVPFLHYPAPHWGFLMMFQCINFELDNEQPIEKYLTLSYNTMTKMCMFLFTDNLAKRYMRIIYSKPFDSNLLSRTSLGSCDSCTMP